MTSDTTKTHKNRSANRYNRFLFCNTFLLPVLYLHTLFYNKHLPLTQIILIFALKHHQIIGFDM